MKYVILRIVMSCDDAASTIDTRVKKRSLNSLIAVLRRVSLVVGFSSVGTGAGCQSDILKSTFPFKENLQAS